MLVFYLTQALSMCVFDLYGLGIIDSFKHFPLCTKLSMVAAREY